jgi:hypothetical protein
MTPAPQGAGVFVSGGLEREEVIEMADDDTGTTTYVRDRGNDSITLETQGSGPEARSVRGAG